VHYLADLQSIHTVWVSLLWQHTCLMHNVIEDTSICCMAGYLLSLCKTSHGMGVLVLSHQRILFSACFVSLCKLYVL